MKGMANRIDFPLGGLRRKAERQERQRLERQGKGKLDRIAQAFEQRARSRDRADRTWLDALTKGRAPFPRKRD